MKTAFLLTLLLIGTLGSSLAQECDTKGRCDKHERCRVWQAQGLCETERDYMKKHCQVSCGLNRFEAKRPIVCKDQSDRCRVWADLGECEANPVNMNKYCAKACNTCPEDALEEGVDEVDPNCQDKHEKCKYWADQGECFENQRYMHQHCARSCGVCPKFTSRTLVETEDDVIAKSKYYGTLQQATGQYRDSTIDRIVESTTYMQSDQVVNLPKNIRDTCKNRHELCSFWASIGECESNVAYMSTNCAVACFSCHLIDFETRCPALHNPVPALLPGDLNKMFERIVATAPGNRTLSSKERKDLAASNMTEYTVHIHSRPSSEPSSEVSVVVDKSMPPWVVTFENFLTPQECENMIQLGYKYEYKRSEDVGARKFDGSHDAVQSEKRTSYNAWCSDFHGCRSEELPKRIHERIAKVLEIPPENSEDFQMLRYEKGAFYRTHHDYIPHQKDRQCGPRILTFFLYLSDVAQGGGTDFPQLNITVMPKRGRALLWPSVLNSNPLSSDSRTYHQAMDVEEGVKYAANGWIHQFDYQTPQKNGCT